MDYTRFSELSDNSPGLTSSKVSDESDSSPVFTSRSSSRSKLALSLLDHDTRIKIESSVYSSPEIYDTNQRLTHKTISSPSYYYHCSSKSSDYTMFGSTRGRGVKKYTTTNSFESNKESSKEEAKEGISLEKYMHLEKNRSRTESSKSGSSMSSYDFSGVVPSPIKNHKKNSSSIGSSTSDSAYSESSYYQGEFSSCYESYDDDLSPHLEDLRTLNPDECSSSVGASLVPCISAKFSTPGTPTTFQSAASSTQTINIVSGKECPITKVGGSILSVETKQLPPLPLSSTPASLHDVDAENSCGTQRENNTTNSNDDSRYKYSTSRAHRKYFSPPSPIAITKLKSGVIATNGNLNSSTSPSTPMKLDGLTATATGVTASSTSSFTSYLNSGGNNDSDRYSLSGKSIPIMLSSPLERLTTVADRKSSRSIDSQRASYKDSPHHLPHILRQEVYCEEEYASREDCSANSDTRELPAATDTVAAGVTATSSSSSSATTNMNNKQATIRKKYNLIKELLNTEIRFSADMSVVLEIYAKRIGSERFFGYIGREDLINLFSNIEQISLLSKQFVELLYKALNPNILSAKPDKSCTLPDEFTNVASAIVAYIPMMEPAFEKYCKNNKIQMSTFFRIKRLACPIIDKWLLECFEDSKDFTSAWTLDSLLIKPVQRFLKYPLILQSLLECTGESHEEYPVLKNACTQMQLCAERINANADTTTTSSNNVEVGSVVQNQTFGAVGDHHAAANMNMKSPDSELPIAQEKNSWSFKKQIGSGDDTAKKLNRSSGCNSQDLLPFDLTADEKLQSQISQFYTKRRHLKNIINSLKNDISNIKGHSDCSDRLIHEWFEWPLESTTTTIKNDATKMNAKSTTTTRLRRQNSKSSRRPVPRPSARGSPSSPYKNSVPTEIKFIQKMNCEVLAPLEQVWTMFDKTEALISARKSYHEAYSKYVMCKQVSDPSSAGNGRNGVGGIGVGGSGGGAFAKDHHQHVTTVEKRKADLFMRYHNSLKDGLSDLFDLTNKVVELSMSKYVVVQKKWFEWCLDSMTMAINIKTDQDMLAYEKRINRHNKHFKRSGGDNISRNVVVERPDNNNNIKQSGYKKPASNDLVVSATSISLNRQLATTVSAPGVTVRRKGSLLSLSGWQKVRPKLSKN